MDRNDSIQISILRFPLMLGVILSHAYSLVSLPGAAIQVSQKQPVAMFTELTIVGLWARLATPLFFLFSGYLLYRGETVDKSAWIAKLKSRVPRLGAPYLIWNGAVFFMYWVGQSIPTVSPFFTKPEYEIAKLDWWRRVDLLLGITRFPIDYQFWFIRDLLVLIVVSPVLWLAVRYVRIPAIGLLVLLWGGWVGEVPTLVAPRALLFFTVGLAFAQASDARLRIPQHSALVIVFVGSTILDAGLHTFLPAGRFDEALGLLSKANICLGICAAWTLAGWLRQSAGAEGLLNYLKQYAFFIFAAHEPLLMTLKKLSFQVLGHDTSAQFLAVYLGTACVTALACLGSGILLEYLSPLVFRVLTAGHGPLSTSSRESSPSGSVHREGRSRVAL
jgi:Acyltransferase family